MVLLTDRIYVHEFDVDGNIILCEYMQLDADHHFASLGYQAQNCKFFSGNVLVITLTQASHTDTRCHTIE